MARNDTKEICSHIKRINISVYYNFKSKQFVKQFYFDADTALTRKAFYSYMDEYLKKYSVDGLQEKILKEFLNQNQVSSINVYNQNLTINNEILTVKNLTVKCGKTKTINILFPDFSYDYLPDLCENIDYNRRNTIIDKYLNNTVDNIIIFPSTHISEIEFYPELKEENISNALVCFNYKSNSPDEKFLNNSDIIYELLEDFYENNAEKIDSFYEDNEKIVFKFSNKKSISIYDKSFIKSISPFINQIQNELIDVKLNSNVKRKVFKYGTNNDGKNGESV